ncbi:MAG: response regulator [Pseudomonadota bacterium]
MTVDLSSFSMLELFRMEAAQLTGGMTTALIDLENHADRPAQLAELMRCAHSLKGAARIVGIDALVGLGHAMEDRLSAAQRHNLLAEQHVDALLKGVDVFASTTALTDAAFPAWLEAQSAQLAELIKALDTDFPAPRAAPVPAQVPALVAAPTSAEAPAPADTPRASTAQQQRSLRLDATQLESLLSLARESLLVNRAHQRQADQLQRLHSSQRQVSRAVERLHEALQLRLPAEQLLALADSVGQAHRRSANALDAHIHDHAHQTRRGHRIASRLHQSIHSTRMTRFGHVEATLKRLARDTGQLLGKTVTLEIQGADTRVDRDVLDRIEAPLMHMVRNAMDHGLEHTAQRVAAGKPACGRLVVSARHYRGQLEVSVGDDGAGVDIAALRQRIVAQGMATAAMLAAMSEAEVLDFLFLPRFTTRDKVSETSGRGVGLDVVQTCVQGLRGRLRVNNRPGAGLTITLVLPVSLSLVRALLLQVGGEIYGLPLSQLERVLHVPVSSAQWIAGQPVAHVNGRDLSWAPLGPILGVAPPPPGPLLTLVEIATAGGRFALAVDALLGERDLALQALDARLVKPVFVAAAAVLDDGRPLLMLDVADLASVVAESGAGASQTDSSDYAPALPGMPLPKRVLVVEDSFTVREVERKVLSAGGYVVDVTVDGVEGWNAVCTRSYDLVVTDIDMPRMNGLELLRRIRANEATRHLPVMIVSYKDREEDRLAGLQAGADRYFVKSGFEEAALLEAVTDLIG